MTEENKPKIDTIYTIHHVRKKDLQLSTNN